ncbi:MAG: flavodoxin domain-containing protein [Anaerolineae bacterium]|nr:flavodoxin domain-containing protein [Anaerolineae bacterium]
MKKMNRRQFLILSGGSLGGMIALCGGGAALSVWSPPADMAQSSCGKEENVTKKVLVAYASKCGSTGEIAQAVGDVLCESGAEVDVKPVKAVTSLSGYDAVIVGTAIRMGQCLPEAKRFVEKHKEDLSKVPLAYFAACLAPTATDEAERKQAETYLDALKAIVKPAAEGVFAGKMDSKKLSLLFRLMMNMAKMEEGDFRDWAAIKAWAQEIQPVLLKA